MRYNKLIIVLDDYQIENKREVIKELTEKCENYLNFPDYNTIVMYLEDDDKNIQEDYNTIIEILKPFHIKAKEM